MDTLAARQQMVDQQILTWEVLDPRVLDVFSMVPREAFVPPEYRELAFADTPIPIGLGQSMLAPKKVKWRKQQKGRMTGLSKGATDVAFGEYALQALSCGFVTSRQIEAARIAISRHVKRGGKLYIRIFPDKPISKKPAETRMGHGKGNPEEWVAVVRPGRVMYELEGVDEKLAREAFHLAEHKLSVQTRFLARESRL